MQKLRAALALVVLYLFPVVVVALILGVMALAIVVGLQAHQLGRLIGQLLFVPLLVGIIAAFREARRARPEPSDGPELTPADSPELWATVNQLATLVQTPAPDRIVVIPEVNAAVSEVGRQRELLIGLPLLAGLTVSELRSVLAHELGHFAGGDTALLARTHRTRAFLQATRANAGSLIRWFFALYYRAYVAVSSASNRDLERRADRFSAEAVGPAVAVAAFRKVVGISLAWDFVVEERVPLFAAAGVRASLSEAVTRALRAHDQAIRQATDQIVASQEPRWDDSHPRYSDRIAAFGAMAVPAPPADNRPALALLGGGQQQALQIEAGLLSRPWPPASWDEVATRASRNELPVRMDRLVLTLHQQGAIDRPSAAAVLAAVRQNPAALGRHLVEDPEHAVEAAQQAALVVVQGSVARAPGVRATLTEDDQLSLVGPDGTPLETRALAADLSGERFQQELAALGAQLDGVVDPSTLPPVERPSVAMGGITMSIVKRPLLVQDILVCTDGLLFVPVEHPRSLVTVLNAVQQRRVQKLAADLREQKAKPGNEWIPVEAIAQAHLEWQLHLVPYRLTLTFTNGQVTSLLFNGYAREIGLLTEHPLAELLGDRFSQGKKQGPNR